MADLEAAAKRAFDFLDEYFAEQDNFGASDDPDDLPIWVQYVSPDEQGVQLEVCFSVADDRSPDDPQIQRIVQQCVDALHAAHPDVKAIGTKVVVYQ